MLRLLIAFALLFPASAEELRTAEGHSIEYYLSLPQGWTAARKWPLVVVIDKRQPPVPGNSKPLRQRSPDLCLGKRGADTFQKPQNEFIAETSL